MPNQDGTGPLGLGPAARRTGRARLGAGGPMGAGGQGQGRRRGGHGRRNMFHQTGLTGLQRAATGQPAWGQTAASEQKVREGADETAQQADTTDNRTEPLAENQTMTGKQLAELRQQATELTAQLDAIKRQIIAIEERA